jgi:hypothetical protein
MKMWRFIITEWELFLILVYVHMQGAQDKKKAKLYGKMGKQIQQVYAL